MPSKLHLTFAAFAIALHSAASSSSSTAPLPAPRLVREPVEVSGYGHNYWVTHIRATPNDLAAFQLVNRTSGAVLRIYYEPGAQATAASKLAYLGWVADQVAVAAAIQPGQVVWHSVVFTADPNYSQPRIGSETRWAVLVDDQGRLLPSGERMLEATLAHEWVHAVQRVHSSLPRWFGEGHASWIEGKIAPRLNATRASTMWADQEKEFAGFRGPTKIAEWTGRTVRREAILRQVSPEERKRMEADPTYTSSGSYSFGPGDLLPEDVPSSVRYAAARKLFEKLEQRAGTKAMSKWQVAIWMDQHEMTTDRIAAHARAQLGIDIMPLLK